MEITFIKKEIRKEEQGYKFMRFLKKSKPSVEKVILV